MTTNELLIPRVKVIAPMPFMQDKVGDILYHGSEGDNHFYGIKRGYISFFTLDEFKQWPNIFEILEWWKDRDVKDMPLFLKKDKNEILKVKSYRAEGRVVTFQWLQNDFFTSDFLPATEEDFLNQNK
jgi:hypothetical protein